MEFGLFLMPIHPPNKPWQTVMREDMGTLIQADKLGFHEAWIGEHHTLMTEPIPAPDLFIAKAFGLTQNIRLGTGVVLLQLHHPIMLANRIAVLDHLGEGRLNFGVGTGGMSTEFELFNIDEESRHARAIEVLDIVLKIWESTERFEYHGQFFDILAPEPRIDLGLSLHMKPFAYPHPPIAMAAGSPNSPTATYAGKHGWIVMSSGIMHPTLLRTIWDAYSKGSIESGRLPDRASWRLARNIHVAKTSKQARKEVNENGMRHCITEYAMKQFHAIKGNLDIFKSGKDMLDSEVTFDWLLEDTFIVGDPDSVAQQIKDLHDRVGGFGTLMLQLNGWDPPEVGLNSLDLFMQEVAPAIRGL